jgi:DNA-binding response OmpR family regulator
MGGGRTVLVVDDDASIRLLCRINLELDDHHVLEAATLDEARRAIASAPVGVVILDVHVGAEDGLAFLAELRRERPGVAVAVLTGSADSASVAAAGPDAVLGKPFVLDELRATVDGLSRGAAQKPDIDFSPA